MTLTKEQQTEIMKAAKPLSDWMKNNCHPHCNARVSQDVVLLQEDISMDFTKPTPTRVPLTRADFNGIPVVWLKSNHGRETLVLEICNSRLYVMNQQFEGLTFDNLLDEWQYSADRINWKPCWKEQ